MKALVKAFAKPGIWLQDVPEPECGINDVKIRIHKTAICGTDIHIYQWDEWSQKTVPVPLVTGHEYFGEIVETGSGVKGLAKGMRVSGEGHITCGVCRNCRAGSGHLCRDTIGVGINRAGAFAEYLVVPASNVLVLPENISDDVASILDPLGNAVHTALTFDLVGEDVLITGAGPIGIMAAVITKHAGARHVVITDVNGHRLDLAKKIGVETVVNVKNDKLTDVMDNLGMQEGFDVGLEMSGNQSAIESMVELMKHGGNMAMLGIPPHKLEIDWNPIIFKGLRIQGIYGRKMFETWYKMISMLQSGLNIEPVITHHYNVLDYLEAFETMASGKSGKVILDWTRS